MRIEIPEFHGVLQPGWWRSGFRVRVGLAKWEREGMRIVGSTRGRVWETI
jgi:hypothetical protein